MIYTVGQMGIFSFSVSTPEVKPGGRGSTPVRGGSVDPTLSHSQRLSLITQEPRPHDTTCLPVSHLQSSGLPHQRQAAPSIFFCFRRQFQATETQDNLAQSRKSSIKLPEGNF